jgi:hypothetical protein
MRALFRKTLLLGVCTAAGSLGAGILAPQEASAQIVSPCMILGSPMPPPCITMDYKRLADIASKRAQDVQKVKAKVEEVKGWANTQTIMGKINEALNTPSLVGKQMFQGLPQSVDGASATTTFAQAKAGTVKFFSEGDASSDTVTDIVNKRNKATRETSVDGLALAYQKGAVLQSTVDDAKRIKAAACKSVDLRTDWAVNSEAKRALAQARATQNYLWQQYLQIYSTTQVARMPVNQGTASLPASTATGGAAAPADNGDMARLQRIAALALEAESIINLLGTSRSADQLQTIVNVTKNDCLDTKARKANLDAQLPIKAQEFACHADKCRNGTIIESQMKAALSRWESEMSALRSQPISSLQAEFDKRQLNVAELMASDTDPRQFIGTWGDPAKYDMLTSIANNLSKGKRDQYNQGSSLDKYIDGGTDERAFAQMLYDWEDVRQEEAWKFSPRVNGEEGSGGTCTEAEFTQDQIAGLQADAQKDSKTTLTQADVTARLQEIAQEGDELGAALTQSTDQNTIDAARGHLAELQEILNRGVKLPDQNGYDQAQCQAAADYMSTQVDKNGNPLSMSAEEMSACLNGSSNPSSPYYVAR